MILNFRNQGNYFFLQYSNNYRLPYFQFHNFHLHRILVCLSKLKLYLRIDYLDQKILIIHIRYIHIYKCYHLQSCNIQWLPHNFHCYNSKVEFHWVRILVHLHKFYNSLLLFHCFRKIDELRFRF